jgi:putative hemolysin
MLSHARTLNSARVFKTFGSFKSAIEKFDSEMRLHHYKIRTFQPNVSFLFERGHYIVKTAENAQELEECLKLRFEVFHREYMEKKRKTGVDVDGLDLACDHLVIRDKRSGKVIGTYRLNSSLFTNTFYSANEFNMDRLLEIPGNKLELGRACIDKEYRTGVIITLLWRGIAEYIQRTDTKVLFGCGSIKTMDPLEIGCVTKYLIEEKALTYEYDVTPTKKFKVKPLDRVLEYLESNPFQYDKDAIAKSLPALFSSYIGAGAKICGEPALDREFRCIDFLTVMRMEELKSAFKGKYKV